MDSDNASAVSSLGKAPPLGRDAQLSRVVCIPRNFSKFKETIVLHGRLEPSSAAVRSGRIRGRDPHSPLTYFTQLPPNPANPLAKRDVRRHPQQRFKMVVLNQFLLKLAETKIGNCPIVECFLKKILDPCGGYVWCDTVRYWNHMLFSHPTTYDCIRYQPHEISFSAAYMTFIHISFSHLKISRTLAA